MRLLLIIDTLAIVFLVYYVVMKDKPKAEEKASDSLSKTDIKALKQVAEVMSYMGDFGHEDQEDTD